MRDAPREPISPWTSGPVTVGPWWTRRWASSHCSVIARSRHHDVRAALGRAIRELRHARQVSQERLAAMAAIDRSYTGGIERGERRATVEKVDQLLTAMGATWIELAEEMTCQLARHTTNHSGKSLGESGGRTATTAPRRSSRRAG
jgi:ribosome-binding protein aMBF1 (putative translation factor)